MKLVGDEASVGKESGREAAIGIAHVDHDVADVLATGDVAERGLHLTDGATFDELEEPPVLEVDDHGHELPKAAPSSTEEVLVEPDDCRPRIEPLAALQLELRVERLVQVAAGTAVGAPDLGQVAEVLAGPQEAPSVPLGAAVALQDAGHRLGERAAAGSTRKAPLAHDEPHRQVPQWSVADSDRAVVVDGLRRCCAARADFELRLLLGLDAQRSSPRFSPAPLEFQLG